MKTAKQGVLKTPSFILALIEHNLMLLQYNHYVSVVQQCNIYCIQVQITHSNNSEREDLIPTRILKIDPCSIHSDITCNGFSLTHLLTQSPTILPQ